MQIKPLRSPMDVVRDWAEELSIKLGRSAQELRARGLGARDFSHARRVELRSRSGFFVAVPLSFCVIDETKGVAVFSEHDGYLEFRLDEDDEVAEIVEDRYVHEG